MIGATIYHYKILQELGSGGMSVVYKAEDLKLGRLVALKFLPPSLAVDEEGKQRFILEARTASSLDHPNICTIYEIDETGDGQIFMAMACYEGETLKQRIERGRLPIQEAVQIAVQIAQGLAKAHGRNIIHCDVKPANIMLTPDGIAKILDFGISKLITQNQMGGTGSTAGTVAYMAPEQTRGDGVDQRADIWSLGVLLYEMISGKRPFMGDLEVELLYAINNEEPVPIQVLQPEVNEGLAAILDRCLAKDPAKRYQSIQEFMEDLSHWQQTESGAGQQLVKKLKWNRGTRLAVILLILVLLVALAPWLRRRADTIPPLSDKTFAVFPFSVNGEAEYQYLEEGMMDLFHTNLNGAGGLCTIDPRTLLDQVRLLKKEKTDVADARRIARLFGARHFLMGSLIAVNGQLRYSASLYDAASTGGNPIPVTANGAADSLFELVDDMTIAILSQYSQTPADRINLLGARTTRSLPALKAFLQGIKEDRDGHWQPARDYYTRAVELDSAFSMAWIHLSYLEWGWLMEIEHAEAALQHARRHGEKLGTRERHRLDYLQAVLDGDHEQALAIVNQQVQEFPDDVWGWNEVATLWIQVANLYGQPVTGRFDAFQQLLRLDPENATNYEQALIPAYLRGNLDEIDRCIARFRQLSPTHNFCWMVLAPRAFITGDPADQKNILQEAREADELNLLNGMGNSVVLAKNIQDVIPMMHIAAEPVRSPDLRASAYLHLALLEMSRGRWHAAMAKLDTLDGLHPGYRFILQGLYSPAYLEHLPPQLRPERVKELPANRQSAGLLDGFKTEMMYAPSNGILKQIEWYTQGLAGFYAGDSVRARICSARLRSSTPPEEAHALVRLWAANLEALLEGQKENFTGALNALSREKVIMRFPLFWSPVYNTAFRRYLYAGALEKLGRSDEALAWYGSIAEIHHYDLPFRAPAALQMARIHEKHGRTAAAIHDYERFLALWRDCDPEFKPLHDEAEARVTALRKNRTTGTFIAANGNAVRKKED